MSWLEGVNDWLAHQLGVASGPTTYLLLLLGGALASLLPCVYPLYPITAAILGRREGSRIQHTFIYWGGLCAVYFLFGIIAALTGGGFNEILRLPLTNLGIGVLLLLLALATAGLLHFPTFASGTGGQSRGRAGTFVMGAGAGLLSSACVGPVVVSILISIAANTAAVTVAVALNAASKMMFFGMGVGLPLLLIGVFGIALPRGGAWMGRIQVGFGALIAFFATGYLIKGLAGLGFSSEASWALVLATLAFGAAAFVVQSAERMVQERTRRALAALTAALAFFVMGRTLLPTQPVLAGAATQAGATGPRTETHGNLTWHLDKESAYAEAALTGRPVFVDFHGDWCTNCKAFAERTLSDQTLNAALAGAVLLKVRDNTALFKVYRDDPRFPELKVGLPFFVITDAAGDLLYKTSDFTKTSEMALFLGE